MADYDQVVSMDSHNLIARFNRGLLRAQIGDNNRAIEDFDVVIEIEPDNYMAYYNRALLRYETGDYQGSVHASMSCCGSIRILWPVITAVRK